MFLGNVRQNKDNLLILVSVDAIYSKEKTRSEGAYKYKVMTLQDITIRNDKRFLFF
jgi:hypothetical protein